MSVKPIVNQCHLFGGSSHVSTLVGRITEPNASLSSRVNSLFSDFSDQTTNLQELFASIKELLVAGEGLEEKSYVIREKLQNITKEYPEWAVRLALLAPLAKNPQELVILLQKILPILGEPLWGDYSFETKEIKLVMQSHLLVDRSSLKFQDFNLFFQDSLDTIGLLLLLETTCSLAKQPHKAVERILELNVFPPHVLEVGKMIKQEEGLQNLQATILLLLLTMPNAPYEIRSFIKPYNPSFLTDLLSLHGKIAQGLQSFVEQKRLFENLSQEQVETVKGYFTKARIDHPFDEEKLFTAVVRKKDPNLLEKLFSFVDVKTKPFLTIYTGLQDYPELQPVYEAFEEKKLQEPSSSERSLILLLAFVKDPKRHCESVCLDACEAIRFFGRKPYLDALQTSMDVCTHKPLRFFSFLLEHYAVSNDKDFYIEKLISLFSEFPEKKEKFIRGIEAKTPHIWKELFLQIRPLTLTFCHAVAKQACHKTKRVILEQILLRFDSLDRIPEAGALFMDLCESSENSSRLELATKCLHSKKFADLAEGVFSLTQVTSNVKVSEQVIEKWIESKTFLQEEACILYQKTSNSLVKKKLFPYISQDLQMQCLQEHISSLQKKTVQRAFVEEFALLDRAVYQALCASFPQKAQEFSRRILDGFHLQALNVKEKKNLIGLLSCQFSQKTPEEEKIQVCLAISSQSDPDLFLPLFKQVFTFDLFFASWPQVSTQQIINIFALARKMEQEESLVAVSCDEASTFLDPFVFWACQLVSGDLETVLSQAIKGFCLKSWIREKVALQSLSQEEILSFYHKAGDIDCLKMLISFLDETKQGEMLGGMIYACFDEAYMLDMEVFSQACQNKISQVYGLKGDNKII
jgi:hypothetical protein